MLDLSSIRQSVLSTPAKGLPPIADGLPVARIPALSLNLLREELSFPLLVIRENALMTNIRSLARAAEDAGVSLAPHGKTTMSPQIFDLQLTAGAWGITLATMHQAAIAAQFGVPRIVLANSVTADADISRLARLHPSPEIIVTSDSVGHARRLATRLTAWGVQTPVPVLVEFGIPNQRS
ncbi:MAG TPA: amino acid deaminase, partial [Spirochaetota bacterium]|nr:amino acid deaminase [Spirochaetota bacterium]